MPRGSSGRIVLEIDPVQKLTLYEVLDADGITLKEWFLKQVRFYTAERLQPSLFSEHSQRAGAPDPREHGPGTDNAP